MPRRKESRNDESQKSQKGYYHISAVARMYNIHPQTLRLYEREGLIQPSRSEGNTRLYTKDDLERLELILNLIRDLGVNLAGVEVVLNMREKMREMENQVNELLNYVRDEFFHGREEEFETRRRGLIPVTMIKPIPVRKEEVDKNSPGK
ncbi:MAG: helix-turn-helix transcriptional regulator [Acidobacteriota bacterium]|nr:helix-turn-helix transcriptional regulator [Acidobacteriota bacterium]